MSIRRRATALGVVGLLALTACGRGDSGSTSTDGEGSATAGAGTTVVDDSPATGDISIWAMGEEGEHLPDFLKDFTAENPDAKVTVTTIPWGDVMTKFQTAVAGGTVPDAIMIGSTGLAAMVAANGLATVPGGLVDNADFFEGAAKSVVADGSTWAVPWYVETRVLYYRSDLADAAGLTAPTTWEELTAFSKGFQEHGSKYGLQLPVGQENASQVILPFYSQQGGAVLNEAGDGYAMDNEQMVDAMSYYASFFTDGISPLSGYGDNSAPSFVDGSNPAFISGPWMISVLSDLAGEEWVEENVATTVVPSGTENNNSYIGGAHLGVFKDAKNPDGAWKIIRWLAQPETQQKWFDATNDLPANTNAWDYEPLQSNERVKVLEEQLKNTVAPPSVPTWDEIGTEISTQSEKLANGKTTPEEAVKAVQAKADSVGLGW